MAHVRYFVIPHGENWLVTLEGRRMARVATRREAINSAIVMADLMGSMGEAGVADFTWGTDGESVVLELTVDRPSLMPPAMGGALGMDEISRTYRVRKEEFR